jgi:hypothetical protein
MSDRHASPNWEPYFCCFNEALGSLSGCLVSLLRYSMVEGFEGGAGSLFLRKLGLAVTLAEGLLRLPCTPTRMLDHPEPNRFPITYDILLTIIQASWPFFALFRRKENVIISYSSHHCIRDCNRHWSRSSLSMDRYWWVGRMFTLSNLCFCGVWYVLAHAHHWTMNQSIPIISTSEHTYYYYHTYITSYYFGTATQ